VCSSDGEGQRRWGADHWQILKRRITTLAAAPRLEDMGMLPGHCHPLHGNREGEFAVSLWGSYRLVFAPNNDPLPLLDDGGLDRLRVTSISIKEVVDYHGD
jgi:proteic killer suppression protein